MKQIKDIKHEPQSINSKSHKSMQAGREKVESSVSKIHQASKGTIHDVKDRANELKDNLTRKQ